MERARDRLPQTVTEEQIKLSLERIFAGFMPNQKPLVVVRRDRMSGIFAYAQLQVCCYKFIDRSVKLNRYFGSRIVDN